MSTRQQRRDWQDFREKHGVSLKEFIKRWVAMTGTEPGDTAKREYMAERTKLREPLGRKKPQAKIATVTRRYEWDMGHRLANHDGKCSRLHGHRYVAEVDVTGPLVPSGSSTGMVVDFGTLDEVLDRVIGHWDHRTLLHDDDLIFDFLESGEAWGIIKVPFTPTAENLACEVARRCLVGTQMNVTRVRIYETPNAWAEWRK